jgi:beta-barrel assembly-enhancing protease
MAYPFMNTEMRYPMRLSLLVALVLATACAGVGQGSLIVSEQNEIELGTEYHKQILQEMPAWTGDPAVSDYVRNLGMMIVPHTHRPNLPHTFTVLDDEQINAFAVPGGFIYVTRGLLQSAKSGAEVATVIAHELGHVSAYHGVQALERHLVAQGLTDMLGGEDLAELADIALNLTGVMVFSQDQEFEADELGVLYASRAGINPWGIVDFFVFLQSLTPAAQTDPVSEIFSDLGELFSTHPPTDERIDAVKAQLGTIPITREDANFTWEIDPGFNTIKALL